MNSLSVETGCSILVVFWLIMFIPIYFENRENKDVADSFLVANRSVGWLRGGLSIAASWVWAPALFIASQKAFDQGLPGAFWFTVPNILALIIFAFLAVRIRELLPNGYTLPQYIKRRFDVKTHIIYVFMFVSLQICSLAVQLLAGASVLNGLTGISIKSGTLAIAFIFLSYSLVSGLKASVRTDFYQMILIIFTCFIIVPLVLASSGGWMYFVDGLGGVSGNYSSILNSEVAINFGILVTIGLLAGPIGDQMHWQRAFALKRKEVKKAYIASGFFFAVVPILLSVLGFVAAGMVKNGDLIVNNSQLSGVLVVHGLLPVFLVVIFLFMLLAGLASTGDSALCAVSSLVSVDIFKEYSKKEVTSQKIIEMSRLTMIIVTAIAIFIALIPKMQILYLFLFYGTLRACDMVPTILSLYIRKLGKNSIFCGVLLAVLYGLSLYVYGNSVKNITIKIAAIVGAVIISFLVPLIITVYSSKKVDFRGNEV